MTRMRTGDLSIVIIETLSFLKDATFYNFFTVSWFFPSERAIADDHQNIRLTQVYLIFQDAALNGSAVS